MSLQLPRINAPAVSELRSDRIQQQAESVEQTLARIGRILRTAKIAAQRGNKHAEAAVIVMQDELYSLLSEMKAEEQDWSK